MSTMHVASEEEKVRVHERCSNPREGSPFTFTVVPAPAVPSPSSVRPPLVRRRCCTLVDSSRESP